MGREATGGEGGEVSLERVMDSVTNVLLGRRGVRPDDGEGPARFSDRLLMPGELEGGKEHREAIAENVLAEMTTRQVRWNQVEWRQIGRNLKHSYPGSKSTTYILYN